MGKNRDRVSLVAAILDAAGAGTSKTRIMFAANMSFKLLEKYLETSLSLGFVQTNGSSYRLTERGRVFLFRFRRFQEMHFSAQKTLNDLADEREKLEQLCQRAPADLEVGIGKANKR